MISFSWANFMADCTFGVLILGFLVRLVWYAKEIVDTLHQVTIAQVQQQATLDKHEAAINAHNMDIALLKVGCPILSKR